MFVTLLDVKDNVDRLILKGLIKLFGSDVLARFLYMTPYVPGAISQFYHQLSLEATSIDSGVGGCCVSSSVESGGMGYSPVDANFLNMARHRFVQLNLFYEVLDAFRFIRFSVKAERDRARDAFLQVRGERLLSVTSRFPTAEYVDLTSGVLASLYASIMGVLDISERNLTSDTQHANDDAKRAYEKSIDRCIQILNDSECVSTAMGIWNRSSLERTLGLTWQQ